MANERSNLQWSVVVAVALSIVACSDKAESGTDDASSLGKVPQALGTWTTLYTGKGWAPLHLSGAFAMYSHTLSGCAQLLALDTASGAPYSVPSLPSCPATLAAASLGSNTVYVLNATNATIYSTLLTIGGGGAGSGPPSVWTTLVTGVGSNASSLYVTPTHLYWLADSSIFRAPIAGGTRTLIASNRTLLGVDGSYLYAQAQVTNGYQLVKIPVAGGAETLISSTAAPFSPWFSFDANNFYWTEDGSSGGINKLLKMTKLSSTPVSPEIYMSSSTLRYQSPVSTGSWLYWREASTGTDGTFQGRSLTNPQLTNSGNFPYLGFWRMVVTSNTVYATGMKSLYPFSSTLRSAPL